MNEGMSLGCLETPHQNPNSSIQKELFGTISKNGSLMQNAWIAQRNDHAANRLHIVAGNHAGVVSRQRDGMIGAAAADRRAHSVAGSEPTP
jgi:hypothetical protein